MIEGSTCDDLSFSAPKLVTPEGDALPSHRQRVGENRRARRCVLAIDAVAKMRRKRAAYAPIRAHYHGMITIFWGSTRRARPRGVPGNSARQARAAADAGIASWSSWRARTCSKAGSAARRAPSRSQRPVHHNSAMRDEGTSSRRRKVPPDPADIAAAIARAHQRLQRSRLHFNL